MKNKRQTKAGSEKTKQGHSQSESNQMVKAFEMGRAGSLPRNLNQRIFIATLRTRLYLQRTLGALRPHFLSHFLYGFHTKGKPQRRASTSTFTVPKILDDGFLCEGSASKQIESETEKSRGP